MQSKLIGTPTIENVIAAFEDLGFTVDNNYVATYDEDTNNKVKFRLSEVSSGVPISVYNDSGTQIHESITLSNSYNFKMTYEQIGNSIIFGFSSVTGNGGCIQFAIVEPSSQEDDWAYIMPYVGTGTAGLMSVIDGKTATYSIYTNTVSSIQFRNGGLGVQIVKHYNGTRFLDNVYVTTISPSIIKQAVSGISDNNFLEATINNDTYLIFNISNDNNGIKFAIKRESTSS